MTGSKIREQPGEEETTQPRRELPGRIERLEPQRLDDARSDVLGTIRWLQKKNHEMPALVLPHQVEERLKVSRRAFERIEQNDVPVLGKRYDSVLEPYRTELDLATDAIKKHNSSEANRHLDRFNAHLGHFGILVDADVRVVTARPFRGLRIENRELSPEEVTTLLLDDLFLLFKDFGTVNEPRAINGYETINLLLDNHARYEASGQPGREEASRILGFVSNLAKGAKESKPYTVEQGKADHLAILSFRANADELLSLTFSKWQIDVSLMLQDKYLPERTRRGLERIQKELEDDIEIISGKKKGERIRDEEIADLAQRYYASTGQYAPLTDKDQATSIRVLATRIRGKEGKTRDGSPEWYAEIALAALGEGSIDAAGVALAMAMLERSRRGASFLLPAEIRAAITDPASRATLGPAIAAQYSGAIDAAAAYVDIDTFTKLFTTKGTGANKKSADIVLNALKAADQKLISGDIESGLRLVRMIRQYAYLLESSKWGKFAGRSEMENAIAEEVRAGRSGSRFAIALSQNDISGQAAAFRSLVSKLDRGLAPQKKIIENALDSADKLAEKGRIDEAQELLVLIRIYSDAIMRVAERDKLGRVTVPSRFDASGMEKALGQLPSARNDAELQVVSGAFKRSYDSALTQFAAGEIDRINGLAEKLHAESKEITRALAVAKQSLDSKDLTRSLVLIGYLNDYFGAQYGKEAAGWRYKILTGSKVYSTANAILIDAIQIEANASGATPPEASGHEKSAANRFREGLSLMASIASIQAQNEILQAWFRGEKPLDSKRPETKGQAIFHLPGETRAYMMDLDALKNFEKVSMATGKGFKQTKPGEVEVLDIRTLSSLMSDMAKAAKSGDVKGYNDARTAFFKRLDAVGEAKEKDLEQKHHTETIDQILTGLNGMGKALDEVRGLYGVKSLAHIPKEVFEEYPMLWGRMLQYESRINSLRVSLQTMRSSIAASPSAFDRYTVDDLAGKVDVLAKDFEKERGVAVAYNMIDGEMSRISGYRTWVLQAGGAGSKELADRLTQGYNSLAHAKARLLSGDDATRERDVTASYTAGTEDLKFVLTVYRARFHGMDDRMLARLAGSSGELPEERTLSGAIADLDFYTGARTGMLRSILQGKDRDEAVNKAYESVRIVEAALLSIPLYGSAQLITGFGERVTDMIALAKEGKSQECQDALREMQEVAARNKAMTTTAEFLAKAAMIIPFPHLMAAVFLTDQIEVAAAELRSTGRISSATQLSIGLMIGTMGLGAASRMLGNLSSWRVVEGELVAPTIRGAWGMELAGGLRLLEMGAGAGFMALQAEESLQRFSEGDISGGITTIGMASIPLLMGAMGGRVRAGPEVRVPEPSPRSPLTDPTTFIPRRGPSGGYSPRGGIEPVTIPALAGAESGLRVVDLPGILSDASRVANDNMHAYGRAGLVDLLGRLGRDDLSARREILAYPPNVQRFLIDLAKHPAIMEGVKDGRFNPIGERMLDASIRLLTQRLNASGAPTTAIAEAQVLGRMDSSGNWVQMTNLLRTLMDPNARESAKMGARLRLERIRAVSPKTGQLIDNALTERLNEPLREAIRIGKPESEWPEQAKMQLRNIMRGVIAEVNGLTQESQAMQAVAGMKPGLGPEAAMKPGLQATPVKIGEMEGGLQPTVASKPRPKPGVGGGQGAGEPATRTTGEPRLPEPEVMPSEVGARPGIVSRIRTSVSERIRPKEKEGAPAPVEDYSKIAEEHNENEAIALRQYLSDGTLEDKRIPPPENGEIPKGAVDKVRNIADLILELYAKSLSRSVPDEQRALYTSIIWKLLQNKNLRSNLDILAREDPKYQGQNVTHFMVTPDMNVAVQPTEIPTKSFRHTVNLREGELTFYLNGPVLESVISDIEEGKAYASAIAVGGNGASRATIQRTAPSYKRLAGMTDQINKGDIKIVTQVTEENSQYMSNVGNMLDTIERNFGAELQSAQQELRVLSRNVTRGSPIDDTRNRASAIIDNAEKILNEMEPEILKSVPEGHPERNPVMESIALARKELNQAKSALFIDLTSQSGRTRDTAGAIDNARAHLDQANGAMIGAMDPVVRDAFLRRSNERFGLAANQEETAAQMRLLEGVAPSQYFDQRFMIALRPIQDAVLDVHTAQTTQSGGRPFSSRIQASLCDSTMLSQNPTMRDTVENQLNSRVKPELAKINADLAEKFSEAIKGKSISEMAQALSDIVEGDLAYKITTKLAAADEAAAKRARKSDIERSGFAPQLSEVSQMLVNLTRVPGLEDNFGVVKLLEPAVDVNKKKVSDADLQFRARQRREMVQPKQKGEKGSALERYNQEVDHNVERRKAMKQLVTKGTFGTAAALAAAGIGYGLYAARTKKAEEATRDIGKNLIRDDFGEKIRESLNPDQTYYFGTAIGQAVEKGLNKYKLPPEPDAKKLIKPESLEAFDSTISHGEDFYIDPRQLGRITDECRKVTASLEKINGYLRVITDTTSLKEKKVEAETDLKKLLDTEAISGPQGFGLEYDAFLAKYKARGPGDISGNDVVEMLVPRWRADGKIKTLAFFMAEKFCEDTGIRALVLTGAGGRSAESFLSDQANRDIFRFIWGSVSTGNLLGTNVPDALKKLVSQSSKTPSVTLVQEARDDAKKAVEDSKRAAEEAEKKGETAPPVLDLRMEFEKRLVEGLVDAKLYFRMPLNGQSFLDSLDRRAISDDRFKSEFSSVLEGNFEQSRWKQLNGFGIGKSEAIYGDPEELAGLILSGKEGFGRIKTLLYALKKTESQRENDEELKAVLSNTFGIRSVKNADLNRALDESLAAFGIIYDRSKDTPEDLIKRVRMNLDRIGQIEIIFSALRIENPEDRKNNAQLVSSLASFGVTNLGNEALLAELKTRLKFFNKEYDPATTAEKPEEIVQGIRSINDPVGQLNLLYIAWRMSNPKDQKSWGNDPAFRSALPHYGIKIKDDANQDITNDDLQKSVADRLRSFGIPSMKEGDLRNEISKRLRTLGVSDENRFWQFPLDSKMLIGEKPGLTLYDVAKMRGIIAPAALEQIDPSGRIRSRTDLVVFVMSKTDTTKNLEKPEGLLRWLSDNSAYITNLTGLLDYIKNDAGLARKGTYEINEVLNGLWEKGNLPGSFIRPRPASEKGGRVENTKAIDIDAFMKREYLSRSATNADSQENQIIETLIAPTADFGNALRRAITLMTIKKRDVMESAWNFDTANATKAVTKYIVGFAMSNIKTDKDKLKELGLKVSGGGTSIDIKIENPDQFNVQIERFIIAAADTSMKGRRNAGALKTSPKPPGKQRKAGR